MTKPNARFIPVSHPGVTRLLYFIIDTSCNRTIGPMVSEEDARVQAERMSAEAMANEPKAPEVSQVERLLAAIDHIVAQGFSTTVEYAIDEAWGLAQDIRAEMAR